jgi:hypothetical protein
MAQTPAGDPPPYQPWPSYPGTIYQPTPVGCICPPGANKECERPDCPRKNHLKATFGGNGDDLTIPPNT